MYKPAERPDTAQTLSWPPPASPSSLSMFGSGPPRQHSSGRETGTQRSRVSGSTCSRALIQQTKDLFRSKFWPFYKNMVLISHLINGLFDFRFLSFSTGKDEVSSEGPDKLQLLPQTIRLCLNGLVEGELFRIKNYTTNSAFLPEFHL